MLPPSSNRKVSLGAGFRLLAKPTQLGVVSIVAVVTLLAVVLRHLTIDDAFITYRYAVNLANGHGFVYNPGEAVLSTTAPLYGLLLAGLAWLGADVPSASNVLGAASAGAGGLLLFLGGWRRRQALAGWLAGLLLALSPLLWLALGMETAFCIALALAAFAADDLGKPGLAGLLIGTAIASRYDTVLAAGIIFLFRLWRDRRFPWRMVAGALIVIAPILVFLTISFGSPLPATLAAKRAQTPLGVTGFFTGTTYLQGLAILARAWWRQTPLYALPAIAFLVGLAVAAKRGRWLAPYVLWALVHTLAYIALGVAPYFWYYAPLLPAVAWLIAMGARQAVLFIRPSPVSKECDQPYMLRPSGLSASRSVPFSSKERIMLGAGLARSLLALAVLTPFAWSLLAIARGQNGALPAPFSEASKVLPEAKGDIYRRAGLWLAANTPAQASVGVTEVGVMGFYAGRPMVDFLGLLQPSVAEALARGNAGWALFAYQPDYLALTAINPIFSFDPLRDDWFQAAYQPVERLDDARFWGSPLIIYERVAPRAALPTDQIIPAEATPVGAAFGEGLRLLAVEPVSGVAQPGMALSVRLWWRADAVVPRDYAMSVQLLGQKDLIIAQRDGQPGLGMRPTSTWTVGEVVADLALLGVPATACLPDTAQLNIAVYDTASGQRLPVTAANGRSLGDSLRLGAFDVRSAPSTSNAPLASFGDAITLVGYELAPRALSPGGKLELTLHWQAQPGYGDGLSAFVHLLPEGGGERIVQSDGIPVLGDDDRRLLVLPSDVPAGVYRPLVGIYRPEAGARLPRLGTLGQPLGDSLPLCLVRVQ